jgi:hypothetical protein
MLPRDLWARLIEPHSPTTVPISRALRRKGEIGASGVEHAAIGQDQKVGDKEGPPRGSLASP